MQGGTSICYSWSCSNINTWKDNEQQVPFETRCSCFICSNRASNHTAIMNYTIIVLDVNKLAEASQALIHVVEEHASKWAPRVSISTCLTACLTVSLMLHPVSKITAAATAQMTAHSCTALKIFSCTLYSHMSIVLVALVILFPTNHTQSEVHWLHTLFSF